VLIRTVFLSSTARDLAPYRETVYQAIRNLDGYHCVRMEDFGARAWAADDFCRARVKECDLFVGIVGHLHGSCPVGSKRSYTEREYEAAVDAGKPCLMFLAPEDFPLPANLIEPDKKRRKQRAFREWVSQACVHDTFTSPGDLAQRVLLAIHNWEQDQMGAEHRPPVVSVEEVMPLPPQPYFAHPYPLQVNFTGRIRERKMLTEWLVGGYQPVLTLTAIGGMGKSALAWAWLQHDVLGLPLPGLAADPPEVAECCHVPENARPEGVLWWSFYEQGARFTAFLDAALAYAGGGTLDLKSIPSAYEKARALVGLLQRRRLLLVLDGFERELRAYASSNAAYEGDAVAEEAVNDFRACTDPRAESFLGWLATPSMRSQTLITSRFCPRELEGLAGCQRVNLTALDPDDAEIFFHAQGVDGTHAEIRDVCASYGYHPLALRLLTGVIARDKRTPGDVRAAARYPLLPRLKGKEQHHILQVAYDAVDEQKRDLLSCISAFRNPMAYAALTIFNTSQSEPEFDAMLDELMDRGLLLFDQKQRRFHLHPIVRSYAYDRLADKAGVHTRLRKYFVATVCVPDEDKVQGLEDLVPAIELYHHTAQAGLYDEAFNLFYHWLARPLHLRLDAYQVEIELLRDLFPDGEDRLPRLKKEIDQAWTLGALATAYSPTGQLRRAMSLRKVELEMYERGIIEERGPDRVKEWKTDIATGLLNLAMDQIRLGELAAAEKNLRRSIETCREVGHEFLEATGHQELGRLQAYQGIFEATAQELDTALGTFGKLGQTQSKCTVRAYYALHALLAGENEAALAAAHQARELADELYGRDIMRAEWLLGTALVAPTTEQDLARAEAHLTEALTRCRRINLVDHEPDILLAWAHWHQAKGNADPIHQYIEESLSIANRCEYRLVQADCHNFLAQLAWQAGDRPAAQEHAEIAHKRAWCDGPPHCYQPALAEAERLLAELG
jgi:tetratricopeptide (TPR) repeat protein